MAGDYKSMNAGRKLQPFLIPTVLFAGALCTMLAVSGATSGGPTDGLLIEAELKQGTRAMTGKVLVDANRTEWTTIASAAAMKNQPALKLEARASLIDSDVVEIETRVTGADERVGKQLAQLGIRSEVSLVEGATTPAVATPETRVAIKVLRVRYSLP